MSELNGRRNVAIMHFGWDMLVDGDKHRIAYRGGVWRGYCPARGTDDLIFSTDFESMRSLTYIPCPHLTPEGLPVAKWPTK